jgi:hypothetical protein
VTAPGDSAPAIDGLQLGATAREFEVERRDELRAVVLALAGQARRSLDIVSRELDPPLYDHQDFAEAVRRLAVSNRRAEIRVLVVEPAPIAARGHRLVDLAQRLSSFIQLRVPAPEQRELNEAWVVADKIGYVHRRLADRYAATVNFDDPRESVRLTNRFEEIWQRANPDPNLRRLQL